MPRTKEKQIEWNARVAIDLVGNPDEPWRTAEAFGVSEATVERAMRIVRSNPEIYKPVVRALLDEMEAPDWKPPVQWKAESELYVPPRELILPPDMVPVGIGRALRAGESCPRPSFVSGGHAIYAGRWRKERWR